MAVTPCATAVSLLRGLYARVARDLGVDVSHVSRIARGERRPKVAEKALNREFSKAMKSIKNGLTSKNQSGGTKKKVRQKTISTL